MLARTFELPAVTLLQQQAMKDLVAGSMEEYLKQKGQPPTAVEITRFMEEDLGLHVPLEITMDTLRDLMNEGIARVEGGPNCWTLVH